MSARKSISSVCLQCCSLIGTHDFFFRKEQMSHETYELSTCVTVFFLNSSIIKVTEGSCCSLEIVGIEKNYFSPTHLEPAGSACLSSLVIERNTGKGANGPAIIQFSAKAESFCVFCKYAIYFIATVRFLKSLTAIELVWWQ